MKIAIIGSGIAGMGAAHHLHNAHEITLYEKEPAPGGHSRTIHLTVSGMPVAVDTGFIVFNRRNYPNLTELFRTLDVPICASKMSFGVSIADGWLEYSTESLSTLFAQKKNLMRGDFYHLIADILRFNCLAKAFVRRHPEANLGHMLESLRMGSWFRDYYLLAMSGAIWSTPRTQMQEFPAKTLVQFFDNHGLLTLTQQPQWYTVRGGSRMYVERLCEPFANRIKTHCAVQRIRRTDSGVEVADCRNQTERYDHVIIACHSSQALALLEEPTEQERAILGSIRYQPNRIVVHSDTRFMPRNRRAWASWVYHSPHHHDNQPSISLTYWMNNLQPLATDKPILVTLNPSHDPDPAFVYDRHTFAHPVFDTTAIHAQSQLDSIQGVGGIWFCGAWTRYGFHEDGLTSGLTVAKRLTEGMYKER